MTKKPLSAPSHTWYREPWPWILMSGPAVVVAAGLVTAWLAVTSADGLVDDDYYKQGLAVNQQKHRNQQADALGLQAEAVRGGDGAQLRVFLHSKAGVQLAETLTLRITHPTRPGFDQKLTLAAEAPGLYVGRLAAPLAGRWHVALEDTGGLWRLYGDWDVDKSATLQLAAGVSPSNRSSSNSSTGR